MAEPLETLSVVPGTARVAARPAGASGSAPVADANASAVVVPSGPNPSPKLGSVLQDMRAGLIVFLIALPLCLGIATASGAPPLSGLIAGMVGGLVVAVVSGSPLSVAGPAAGLTVITLDGINKFGLPTFLMAVLIAGMVQIAIGLAGAGRLGQLVPNAVIRGMLAAIGLILVLKQLPHAVGYDADPEGDFAFVQGDGHNTFSELFYSLEHLTAGAVLISLLAFTALFAWRNYPGLPLARYVPKELVAVCVGVIGALLFQGTSIELSPEHRVSVPLLQNGGLSSLWTQPEWAAIQRWDVWKLGITLAIVASIESLLCLEATDRIDPLRRSSPPNRELLAQGLGNMASGALGGLPVTAVVVRSFTNVQAGGRTRVSAIVHGVLIVVVTLGFAHAINYVPLAALAVVLLMVGYKLTPPSLYVQVWRMGRDQFLPFITTVLAILVTDLLTGTLLGLGFAIFFVIWGHYSSAIVVTDDGRYRMIRFVSSVSFLHKARLRAAFDSAAPGGHVILDGSRARAIDPDIVDAIADFAETAKVRGIELSIQRSDSALHSFFRTEARA
jgi:MFS superfamily sulfate permease-like transporter